MSESYPIKCPQCRGIVLTPDLFSSVTRQCLACEAEEAEVYPKSTTASLVAAFEAEDEQESKAMWISMGMPRVVRSWQSENGRLKFELIRSETTSRGHDMRYTYARFVDGQRMEENEVVTVWDEDRHLGEQMQLGRFDWYLSCLNAPPDPVSVNHDHMGELAGFMGGIAALWRFIDDERNVSEEAYDWIVSSTMRGTFNGVMRGTIDQAKRARDIRQGLAQRQAARTLTPAFGYEGDE